MPQLEVILIGQPICLRALTVPLLATVLVCVAPAASQLEARNLLLSVRGAYFYPTDDQFCDIYSSGWSCHIESAMQLWGGGCHSWTSVGYQYASGSLSADGSSTHLYTIPIGAGAKYIFGSKWIQPYLGLGAVPTYLHLTSNSNSGHSHQSKWGLGGIAKGGILTHLASAVFLDLFLDYTYLQIDLNTSNLQTQPATLDLSGLSIGGGLGYRF